MSTGRGVWADVIDDDWNDWRWQQRHRIDGLEMLESVIDVTASEREAIRECKAWFRMAITPYYALLMDPTDPDCPIRRQAVPHLDECLTYPGMSDDPLAEEAHSPVDGVVHRYPDRVLLYVSHNCPVYCRHCTRKRKVGDPSSTPAGQRLDAAIRYIEQNDKIHDVLISGGDPLTLSNQVLGRLLERLGRIPHLDLIRIGTRNPVTLPQRIDEELCAVLRTSRSLYVHTHFNHPKECTPEAGRALDMLADAGCVLGNQMVLLKGVNTEPAVVVELNRWLLRHRCRPYYILHCDAAPGVAHFRTTLDDGRRVIKALRGHVSGLAVPQYVVDLSGGGGKVPVVPDYLIAEGPQEVVFRNYQGRVHGLTQPQ
ncbi:MAG: lysine 2,3-aminomutase [Myxococcales bacterium]|nr:lysine 2,3-aminomutase [Myxococcales bacterium]|tara:strand:- start:905 stop:2011 length:1107 start_codon:yes stop_codon:yes gene_type:complete